MHTWIGLQSNRLNPSATVAGTSLASVTTAEKIIPERHGMSRELLDELMNLASRWKKWALEQVPPDYAKRDLHHKYLKLDNCAAGVDDCALELEALIEEFTRPAGPQKEESKP